MNDPALDSSFPPPPRGPSVQLGPMFKLRPSGPRLWFSLRAALCMGAPVAAGWAGGDVAAGLTATLGAFTSLYGPDRPYLNRSILLAVIALSFAFSVTLGILAQPYHAAVIAVVVLLAMAATFLCHALRVGPPGAYMFTLACAAGTALPTAHLTIWQIGLLVLAGGAFSWLVLMSGALFRPRGPESTAVRSAAAAVARFAEAVGTSRQDEARHVAAMSLHDAWTTLVARQPAKPRPDGTLSRLRAVNRALHQLFAEAINAGHESARLADVAAQARRLGAAAALPEHAETSVQADDLPLGHHGMRESLQDSLRAPSPALLTTARVGIAAAIAGSIGTAFALEHAYWSVAAAVLVLHQGLDWTRTLQRGIERMSGTLVGLALAGVILMTGLSGLWLAAILTLLQFLIELIVVRNYALAVVFITALALLIATGGHDSPDIGHLLWARGLDTIVGCLVGIAVHLATAPRSLAVPIPQEIARTLAAIEDVLALIAEGDVTTKSARQARRDLQHRAIMLLKAYDGGIGATARDRSFAEEMWPAVVATQRLAYRVLATCWAIENAGRERAHEMGAALLGNGGLATARQALTTIATAIRAEAPPPSLSAELPEFLRADLQNLCDSLPYRAQHDQVVASTS